MENKERSDSYPDLFGAEPEKGTKKPRRAFITSYSDRRKGEVETSRQRTNKRLWEVLFPPPDRTKKDTTPTLFNGRE